MTSLDEIVGSPDWEAAFNEAGAPSNPLTREVAKDGYAPKDIKRVIAAEDGENDGDNWLGLFEMADGRFLSLRAGCDYTGWDCQASGSAEWTSTEDEARACLTPEERGRLFP